VKLEARVAPSGQRHSVSGRAGDDPGVVVDDEVVTLEATRYVAPQRDGLDRLPMPCPTEGCPHQGVAAVGVVPGAGRLAGIVVVVVGVQRLEQLVGEQRSPMRRQERVHGLLRDEMPAQCSGVEQIISAVSLPMGSQ
jgi:hypothetical protein